MTAAGLKASSERGRSSVQLPFLFPSKLYDMLQDCESDPDGKGSTASWLPDGKSFRIHNVKDFVATIMPEYFNQSKYKSFQRQLNLWGFDRITSVGPEKGAYFHSAFVRDGPLQLEKLRRVRAIKKIPAKERRRQAALRLRQQKDHRIDEVEPSNLGNGSSPPEQYDDPEDDDEEAATDLGGEGKNQAKMKVNKRFQKSLSAATGSSNSKDGGDGVKNEHHYHHSSAPIHRHHSSGGTTGVRIKKGCGSRYLVAPSSLGISSSSSSSSSAEENGVYYGRGGPQHPRRGDARPTMMSVEATSSSGKSQLVFDQEWHLQRLESFSFVAPTTSAALTSSCQCERSRRMEIATGPSNSSAASGGVQRVQCDRRMEFAIFDQQLFNLVVGDEEEEDDDLLASTTSTTTSSTNGGSRAGGERAAGGGFSVPATRCTRRYSSSDDSILLLPGSTIALDEWDRATCAEGQREEAHDGAAAAALLVASSGKQYDGEDITMILSVNKKADDHDGVHDHDLVIPRLPSPAPFSDQVEDEDEDVIDMMMMIVDQGEEQAGSSLLSSSQHSSTTSTTRRTSISSSSLEEDHEFMPLFPLL